jgi:hypothetical protein
MRSFSHVTRYCPNGWPGVGTICSQEVRCEFRAWHNTATAVPHHDDGRTALFDSYEHDFNQFIDDVRHNLDGDVGAGKDDKSEFQVRAD